MLTIGGLLLLFGCVLGSYILSGGSMEPLIEAVPFEMWTIGGAALAQTLIGNSLHDVKHMLGAFGKMPDKANLPIIAAIWKEYSEKAWVGNELRPFEVMQALKTHKYPEAIPLMAQFADVGFAQDIAHDFLVEMSGVDFGRDVGKWVDWYRSHKSELEARQ